MILRLYNFMPQVATLQFLKKQQLLSHEHKKWQMPGGKFRELMFSIKLSGGAPGIKRVMHSMSDQGFGISQHLFFTDNSLI